MVNGAFDFLNLKSIIENIREERASIITRDWPIR